MSAPAEKGASKGEGNMADKGQSAALAEVESSDDEGGLPEGGEEGN